MHPDAITLSFISEQFTSIEEHSTFPLEVAYACALCVTKKEEFRSHAFIYNLKDMFIVYFAQIE